MTPTAKATLAWLQGERRFWAETADEDELNTFMRTAAIARRDQLDMILQRLPRELEAVEIAAVAEDRGVAEWLDAGAGIGDGGYGRMHDFEEACGAECGCAPGGLAA